LWSQNASQFTLIHLGRISTGADPQRLKLELTIGQSVNAIAAVTMGTEEFTLHIQTLHLIMRA